ncbi:site-specific tyrosine recombinase XerD [Microlunatus kandeliicorticis]
MTRLVGDYLDHLVVERGLSTHTVAAYRRDLERYRDFVGRRGVEDPRAIDTALVNAYAVSLREGVPADGAPDVDEPSDANEPSDADAVAAAPRWRHPPLAEASTARALVAVRNLHRFAAEEGVVEENVAAAVRPPRAARRLPKALGVDQVQRLLDAPGQDDPLALRDRALLELLYGTGGRISEIVALDVDELSGLLTHPDAVDGLRVLGKGSKERIVPLGRYAKRAVTDYLVRARPGLAARGSGSPALLLNARGGRLSRQSAWSVLQARADQAGLGVAISPHTLRHSFATHLLDGGADVRVVQELLGHASVTTTQIYTLVTVDHLREVYLTAHPRAR